jgi:hypothetical protein
LQHALEQPLTDYNEVPVKWNGTGYDFRRETKASINRQLPRRRQPAKGEKKDGSAALSAFREDENQTPAALEHQQHKRERTFQQIDFVLDRMNETTQKISHASNNSHGGEAVGGPNTAVSITQQNVNVRKSVENMRYFMKPHSIRELQGMMQNIIEEFNT